MTAKVPRGVCTVIYFTSHKTAQKVHVIFWFHFLGQMTEQSFWVSEIRTKTNNQSKKFPSNHKPTAKSGNTKDKPTNRAKKRGYCPAVLHDIDGRFLTKNHSTVLLPTYTDLNFIQIGIGG
jgi:hypothetical protein